MRRYVCLLLIFCAGCFLFMLNACNHPSSIEDRMPEVVSYNFNIRPILSDKC